MAAQTSNIPSSLAPGNRFWLASEDEVGDWRFEQTQKRVYKCYTTPGTLKMSICLHLQRYTYLTFSQWASPPLASREV